MRAGAIAILIGAVVAMSGKAQTPPPPLVREAKIPLGQVRGRIDHLAVDPRRRRLFIAELGNNSLGVVDLAASNPSRTISGLSERQGVGYEPTTDTVAVADAGDGSVRFLRGEDLAEAGRIALAEDADNVRIDRVRHRLVVGYRSGALALLDPTTRTKVGDIRLKAHPESFQIDGEWTFVNVPDAGLIEVVDLAKRSVGATWPTGPNRSNFPMAIDRDAHQLFVVFRRPARLMVMSTADGNIIASFDSCGDADDLLVDAKHRRIYMSCGAGVVDVFEAGAGGYQPIGQFPTRRGARTSLFVPEMDRLFVAVRAAGDEPAAIWVFRPG